MIAHLLGVYLMIGAGGAAIFAIIATCTEMRRREGAVASAPWPVMALVIVAAWPAVIAYTLAHSRDPR